MFATCRGWRNDITQFMSGAKELGLCCIVFVVPQLIAQLNRFLTLQALVEGLGMWWATFGLKFPILLNWVRLRPGIWESGTISSTDWGAARAPTQGCLGFAPRRWSKQCGMDILPIFLLRLGSNLFMWMASLASCVILGGIFVYDVKIRDGRQRVVEYTYTWSILKI